MLSSKRIGEHRNGSVLNLPLPYAVTTATLVRAGAVAAIALTLLAGCAPDSFRRKPEFEAWIREVRHSCYFERIGTNRVGTLLGSAGSLEGNHFLNETSRLYAGQITPEEWTSRVLAFIGGRPSDPGVRCVLDRLPS